MPTPRNLGPSGRKLWRFVTDDNEMAPHEEALLEEACRTRDRIAEMQEQVEADGVMIASSQGARLHPAIAEERQQRLALARLLVTLGVPGLDEDNLPASRGVRGVYAGKGRR